jgi:hypothetical protein
MKRPLGIAVAYYAAGLLLAGFLTAGRRAFLRFVRRPRSRFRPR